MKSKFVFWLEAAADKMFSEKAQSVGLMATFGTLGVAALIGAFWNPWQLFIAGMCAIMFLCGLSEYNKVR
jgi:hypothetical protein